MSNAYQKLKAIADGVRAERMAARTPNTLPYKESSIPSSVDKGRKTTVQIYEPKGLAEEHIGPVVINLHGSGFVIPSLGQNAPWCTRTAQRLGIRVVDADYAKAPEHPFPACFHDTADVIRWTLAQPWCSGRIVLNGWSAGGALALAFSAQAIAAKYGLSTEQSQSIAAATAFYPPAGATNDTRFAGKTFKDQEWLDTNGYPGIGFTRQTLDFFDAAFLLGSDQAVVRALPEISPLAVEHPAAMFKKPLTIIGAEYDVLRDEADLFARTLTHDGHLDVVYCDAEGTSHGWDSRITKDEALWTEETKGGAGTKKAYDLVEKRIREALRS